MWIFHLSGTYVSFCRTNLGWTASGRGQQPGRFPVERNFSAWPCASCKTALHCAKIELLRRVRAHAREEKVHVFTRSARYPLRHGSERGRVPGTGGPLRLWQRLHELLTEKGVLIVAVPNCSSYDAKRYGEYWAAYDVPRHLWHFTPGTIQQLASRHGFIMAARHPMPFDAFYVSMLSEKHRGSSCSFLKGMFAGTLAWFNALGRKERSSSMIYVFRKKR